MSGSARPGGCGCSWAASDGRAPADPAGRGRIYIDGRRLAEPYLPAYDPLGPAIPDASRQHPYRVPPGEFYVLGDNRADSCDSRYWGPIEGSSIVGKVVLTFWHNSHPEFRRF